MRKIRLPEARRRKGFSQEYVAKKLNMDTACYNRRERGLTKISSTEWQKLSEILEISVEEIKDVESPIMVTSLDEHGTEVQLFSIPKEFVDNRTRYIRLLEDRVLDLENQIFELKSKN